MALATGRLPRGTPSTLDRYLKEISAYPLIDRGEEARLAEAIRAGDPEALDKLVRSNLRFVVSVAKRYQNQGVPLSDLISEGNVGLIRAAHRFDETKGIKFISYAVWWVRQAILQALAEQSRIVRIPLNRAGQVHRVSRRRATLRQELGRDPTLSELASDTGLPLGDLEATIRVAQSHLSLDGPANKDDDGQLMDYLRAEDHATDRETLLAAMRATVERALGTLTARQAKILRLYYGLDNQPSMTLEEIGRHLGVTRERVRQIKETALHRLRHASRMRHLEAYRYSFH